MRKHLAALLSMLGLAGSTLPATAQVVKGSKEAAATTAETKVKADKTKKGVLIGLSQAGKSDGDVKQKKNLAEKKAVNSGIQDKRKKLGAEKATSHDDKWNKANAQLGDGSVRKATIGGGGGAGKVSVSDVKVKSNKNATEAQAASSQASKKAAKGSVAPKQ